MSLLICLQDINMISNVACGEMAEWLMTETPLSASYGETNLLRQIWCDGSILLILKAFEICLRIL
jgi:hypothetical protein